MSRITPRLLARVGRTPMFLVGTLGLATSFAWLSQVSAGDTYLSGAFGPMLLNGLSAGLVFMPATSSVLAGVAPQHAGSASGLLQTFQQLGGAIGLAVIVSVYAAGAQPGRFLPGADHAFQTSAIFALTAFLVAALTATRLRRAPVVATEPLEAPEPAEAA
jgi:MFS family permease